MKPGELGLRSPVGKALTGGNSRAGLFIFMSKEWGVGSNATAMNFRRHIFKFSNQRVLTGLPAWRSLVLAAGLLAAGAGCGQSDAPQPVASPARPPENRTDQVQLQRVLQNVIVREPTATTAALEITPPPAKTATVPVYELKLEVNNLRQLDANAYGNETVPAVFTANGAASVPVKVRYRGQWSRSWPKKGMKIQFETGHSFEGHGSLNLNSGWRDPAMIRETLAYQIFQACGVPSSRSRLVRLVMNGKFRGLYVEVESVDKAFLERWKLKGAEVYKAVSRDNLADERMLGNALAYVGQYEREGKKVKAPEADGQVTPEMQAAELVNVQAFCQEMSETKDKRAFFTQRVNVAEYINYLAANVLLQNWDSYSKNHYLVFDAEQSKQWLVVPWDLDRTFGDHWNQTFGESHFPISQGTRKQPGVTGWNRMQERFLSVPEFRARFLDRLEALLEKEFTPEKLFPVIDQLQTDIAGDAELDFRRWPRHFGELADGIAGLKAYIQERRDFLRDEVKRLRQTSKVQPQSPKGD